jgi:predicted ATPase
MDILKIDKFFNIENVEIPFNDITIFIGKEGTGKSIISKLYYFMGEIPNLAMDSIIYDNEYLIEETISEIFKGENIPETIAKIYFPDTDKSNKYFISIEIENYKLKRLEFGLNLKNELRIFKKEIENLKEELKEENFFLIAFKVKETFLLRLSHISKIFYKKFYIPSDRAMVKKLYPFVPSETVKRMDYIDQQYLYLLDNTKYLLRNKNFLESVERFIGGKADFRDLKVTFSKNGLIYRVPFSHLSSGQQNLLYLLNGIYSVTLFPGRKLFTIFIEEPEAHIFPETQYNLVKLFGELYNEYNNPNFPIEARSLNIVIETHSPYILSAFNNLMYAYEVFHRSNDEESKNKIKSIIDEKQMINPKKVTCYSTNKFCSIMEDNLIVAEEIDNVSDIILNDFNSLNEFNRNLV